MHMCLREHVCVCTFNFKLKFIVMCIIIQCLCSVALSAIHKRHTSPDTTRTLHTIYYTVILYKCGAYECVSCY